MTKISTTPGYIGGVLSGHIPAPQSPTSPPRQRDDGAVAIYHGRCVIDCGAHGHLDMELLKLIPAGTRLYAHSSSARDRELMERQLALLEVLRPMTAYGVVGTRDVDQAKYRAAIDEALAALRARRKEPT